MIERGPPTSNAAGMQLNPASIPGPSSAIVFTGASPYGPSLPQVPILYAPAQAVVNLASSAHLAAFPQSVYKPFGANSPVAAAAFFPAQYQVLQPVWPGVQPHQAVPAFLAGLRPSGPLCQMHLGQRMPALPSVPRAAAPSIKLSQKPSPPASLLPPSISSVDSANSEEAIASEVVNQDANEGSGWAFLVEGVLQLVVKYVVETEVKNFRLACKHWRYVVDQNLEVLTPSSLKPKVVISRFPRLHTLQLISCPNVRNRDLFILSQGALNLQSLNIGDEINKPWVTNRGLASIALITSITSLSLNDCNSLTNNGLTALNKLSRLVALSLKGCKKITNNGLEVLQQNTSLTSLNLVGCVRISDKALAPTMKLPLKSLHLGLTRVRDEGMQYIAKITTLTDLLFFNEELTDAGLKQLTTLTNLQALALQDCCEITGDALTAVIPHFPQLTHLDLHKNWEFDDAQLAACLPFMSNLRSLDLRATWVSQHGLAQLVQLSNLKRLGLAPHLDLLADSLGVISVLTQLTALTVTGCSYMSDGFLSQITCLTNLRELNLSGDDFTECPTMKEPISDQVVETLAEFTSLTTLDLSRRPVYEHHVNFLAQRLRRMRTLHLAGCPIAAADVLALERKYPHIDFVRQVPKMHHACSNIRWTVT